MGHDIRKRDALGPNRRTSGDARHRTQWPPERRPAQDNAGPLPFDAPHPHAAERWADAVMKVVSSGTDPKTIRCWGRCVGVCSSTLKSWCLAACVSARRSLLLARVLRAVVLGRSYEWRLEDFLNVADRRTIRGIKAAAGIGDPHHLPTDPIAWLMTQTIVVDQHLLTSLTRALARHRN